MVNPGVIWDALRNLVAFEQFKKRENTHGGVIFLVKLQAEALFHGCFSSFLNCTNGTKLRKASHFCLNDLSQIVNFRILLDPFRFLFFICIFLLFWIHFYLLNLSFVLRKSLRGFYFVNVSVSVAFSFRAKGEAS